MKSTGRCFVQTFRRNSWLNQRSTKSHGPKLDALTAEKVFGWKSVQSMTANFTVKDRIRLVAGGQPNHLPIQPKPFMRTQSKNEWNSLGNWIDT